MHNVNNTASVIAIRVALEELFLQRQIHSTGFKTETYGDVVKDEGFGKRTGKFYNRVGGLSISDVYVFVRSSFGESMDEVADEVEQPKWQPYQAWIAAGINGFAVYERIDPMSRPAHWAFHSYIKPAEEFVSPPSFKKLFKS